MSTGLQDLCENGQRLLMRMQYAPAEAELVKAEALALAAGDFDALARLYMPLQECRRQKRQLCGEGIVRLDVLASGPGDAIDARKIADECPQGQLLVAGWGELAPAVELRRVAAERQLYLETFLAAVFPLSGGGRAVVIVPTAAVTLPAAEERSIDGLIRLLPPHSIVIPAGELPAGPRRGDAQTYAHTMAMWERLHSPFLARADATPDPRARIEAYRRVIEVDYACELAHQKLSDTARLLLRPAD